MTTATYTVSTPAAAIQTIPEALAAAIDYNNDWYGLSIYSRTLADIEATSDYIQGLGASNPKIFFAQNAASEMLDVGASSDIASLLTAKANFRTSVWYHADNTEFLEMALMGGQLPTLPGSITWAYKSLSTITVDTLTDGQKAAVHSKNANTYDTVASVAITEEGKTCDTASGEWIDVIRGVDWIQVNMSADLYTLLVNSPKVPYSTAGISSVKGVLINVLATAQTQGILTLDEPATVTVPDIADVSAGDKGTRTLNDVTFTGILAGAIQKINVQGTVTLV